MARIKLTPLLCPSCSVPLTRIEGSFTRCDSCGKAYEVEDTAAPVTILTSTEADKPKPGWFPWSQKSFALRPFWLFNTEVEISRRRASGNVVSFFTNLFKGKESGRVAVFVPANAASHDEFMRLGLHYTEQQPSARLVKSTRVTGVTLSCKSAEDFILPILVGIEAKKPDTLHAIALKAKVQGSSLVWLWA